MTTETAAKPARGRFNYLTPHQFASLVDWAIHVRDMFGAMPYQVGSSLDRPDYRDVDVRLILPDADFAKLGKRVKVWRLNHVVSMWGCTSTGLLIDFQIQSMTEANGEYGGRPRNALFRVAGNP